MKKAAKTQWLDRRIAAPGPSTFAVNRYKAEREQRLAERCAVNAFFNGGRVCL